MFETSPATTVEKTLDKVIDSLAKSGNVDAVLIMGSGADETLGEHSDYDLALVVGESPQNLLTAVTYIDRRLTDVFETFRPREQRRMRSLLLLTPLVAVILLVGCTKPEPLGTPATLSTPPSTLTLVTSTPVLDEQAAWDEVARSVQAVSPVLRPQFMPPGIESARVQKAGLGTFWVEYSGPGKRLGIGAGAFNPSMVTTDSGGEQRRVTVRGQPATLQMKSRARPSESVQLWWQEPGEWVPGAGAPMRDRVFYMISAQGLEPDVVLQLANSLRPM